MEISNYADMIDSRDVIERIEELEAELSDWVEDGGSPDDFESAEELKMLMEFANEASQYADDWQYGVTLIRYSYFTEYAEQFAKDTVDDFDRRSDEWPLMHIDWDAAADDLQQDYTTAGFDGVDYWVRCS